ISLSTITNQQAKSQEQNDSELILSSISLLRKTFDEAFKIFDRINEKPQELQHFSPDLYWNSLPTFIFYERQEKHEITYCSPINEPPTSTETATAILKTTKAQFIESGFQEKAVIIMDEGLYHSVIKVKDQNPLEFEAVILLGGDFHALMNYMRMVWSVLDDSGIHELLNYLYQGATLKSVINVTNFNKSLRATKLLYTALYVACFEQFLTTTNVQQNKSVHIDSKMTRMKTLKLIDIDTYGAKKTASQKKQTTKQYETKLRDLIVVGSQDHDINLIDYLKYEYYDVPPALSDNFQLLNPSNNNKVIEYFMENYPQQFAFTQSNDELEERVLLIDRDILLQHHPKAGDTVST
ncbi:unnamed protein product, partial [Didymodactylos carnosus]